MTDEALETTADTTRAAARRQRFLASTRPALDRIYRLAGLLLGNATEAEDAVQDPLVVTWQRFEDLREPVSPQRSPSELPAAPGRSA